VQTCRQHVHALATKFTAAAMSGPSERSIAALPVPVWLPGTIGQPNAHLVHRASAALKVAACSNATPRRRAADLSRSMVWLLSAAPPHLAAGTQQHCRGVASNCSTQHTQVMQRAPTWHQTARCTCDRQRVGARDMRRHATCFRHTPIDSAGP
jgi:hypothetical protein